MTGKLSDDELKTGALFGGLFSAFDMENYLRSVEIFKRRFEDNGFDITYFKGKNCLDVGCGGGRYSIALSKLGAAHVTGIDISESGVADAKKRAAALGIDNVSFGFYSGEQLPFDDSSFDLVIFSGVLMHMENPDKGLAEVARVLKSNGMLYGLVYATEGVRWPLINILRNISTHIGFEKFDLVLQKSGLDVNKRRTYLDDLFVPNIDFYSWKRLLSLLERNGFHKTDRWRKGRLDHEESLDAYYTDLSKLTDLFISGAGAVDLPEPDRILFQNGRDLCQAAMALVESAKQLNKNGHLSPQESERIAIGQGHHRFTTFKA